MFKLLFSVQYGHTILPLDKNNWTSQFYPVYGRCFTYNLPNWLQTLRVLDIVLELNQSSYIFVHHPGQFLNADSKSKIEGIVGKNLFIDVEHDVIT